MRLYLAGPMRGYPRYNFDAFYAAEERLVALGHEIISPARHDVEDLHFDPDGPLEDWDQVEGIKWDLMQILAETTDGVVLLPGWNRSSGATLEKQLAGFLGKPCYEYSEDTLFGLVLLWEGPHKIVIGLSGYAYSGKDEVGKILVSKYGFTRRAKGDLIRDALLAINPRITLGTRIGEIVTNLGWDEAKKHPEVRRLLQELADRLVDVLGVDVWNERVFRDIDAEGLDRVVLTRLSLPQEAETIKARGGLVWRVERHGYGPINDNHNEVALDKWPFDYTIYNHGTLEDLECSVDDAVRALRSRLKSPPQ